MYVRNNVTEDAGNLGMEHFHQKRQCGKQNVAKGEAATSTHQNGHEEDEANCSDDDVEENIYAGCKPSLE